MANFHIMLKPSGGELSDRGPVFPVFCVIAPENEKTGQNFQNRSPDAQSASHAVVGASTVTN